MYDERRIYRAQRRLLTAAKALATVRRLTLPVLMARLKSAGGSVPDA